MMAYNSLIHGLVTRDSSEQRTRSPHRRAGLTKLQDGVQPSCTRQPSLSPFTYVGFVLSSRPPVCGTSVVQGGLSSYTSTPELERRAKTRSGWYAGRLRVCARPALSLVNAIATNWLRRNTKADTVSLR